MARVMVVVKAKNLRVGDWLTIYGEDMAPRVVAVEGIEPPDYGSSSYSIEIKGRVEEFSFKPNQRVVVYR